MCYNKSILTNGGDTMLMYLMAELPATEDSRNIILWVILAAVAAVLVGITGAISSKKSKNSDDDDDKK